MFFRLPRFHLLWYNQLQKYWDTPTIQKLTFLTLNCCSYITRLWDMILISLLPSIQRCSSKFWAWSCIVSNFDKGRRGDHKHKIINCASVNVWSAVKAKQGTVSQGFLQVVVAGCFWQGLYHAWNCLCLYWKFHNLTTHEALRCSYEIV